MSTYRSISINAMGMDLMRGALEQAAKASEKQFRTASITRSWGMPLGNTGGIIKCQYCSQPTSSRRACSYCSAPPR